MEKKILTWVASAGISLLIVCSLILTITELDIKNLEKRAKQQEIAINNKIYEEELLRIKNEELRYQVFDTMAK